MAAYGRAGSRAGWRRTERRDYGKMAAPAGRDGGGAGRVVRQRRGRGTAQEDGGRRAAPVSNRGRGGRRDGGGRRPALLLSHRPARPSSAVRGGACNGLCTGDTGVALGTAIWRWDPVLGTLLWPWERRTGTGVPYWGHWCGSGDGALVLGTLVWPGGRHSGTGVLYWGHWCGPGDIGEAPVCPWCWHQDAALG